MRHSEIEAPLQQKTGHVLQACRAEDRKHTIIVVLLLLATAVAVFVDTLSVPKRGLISDVASLESDNDFWAWSNVTGEDSQALLQYVPEEERDRAYTTYPDALLSDLTACIDPQPKLYRLAVQETWPGVKAEPLCIPLGPLVLCHSPLGQANIPSTHPGNGASSSTAALGRGEVLPRETHSLHGKSQALEVAFREPTTTTPAARMRSAGQVSSPRLRQAFRRMAAGLGLKAVLLGGSVSVGMGVRDRNNSFASLVSSWLRSFEPVLGGNTTMINAAVAATTSSYAAQCVHDFVPEDADVVFMEYALNDWEVADQSQMAYMDNYQRRGFERLVRRVASYPRAPAIILVHWWSPWKFDYSFWNVAEDQLNVVGNYYGASHVSFRDAYFHQIMTGAPNFNLTSVMCDAVHPNKLGHRYLADLIIAHLQHALVDALLVPARQDDVRQRLPPPLFMNNSAAHVGTCARGDTFKQTVILAKGFDWKDSAKEGAPQAKWGYVGSAPGAELVIQVGSGKPRNASMAPAGEDTLVALGMLMSYKDMGIANISCQPPPGALEPCSCEPWIIDTTHRYNTSQVYWNNHIVLAGSDCRLHLLISNETSSGGHKVVVTSLMVSDDTTSNVKGFNSLGSGLPLQADGDNSVFVG